MEPHTVFFLVTAILVFILATKFRPLPTGGRKIPGPKGLPFIGNLLQLPKEQPWIQLEKWSRQYGPIYQIRVGMQNIIVLGNAKTAIELLDKRSSKYSDRPDFIMVSQLVSRGLRMTFMKYDGLWKRERKLLHQLTQPRAAASYQPIQSQESAQLILDLLDAPKQYWGASMRYAGSTIMQVAFGERATSVKDPAITDMRAINDRMIRCAAPGAYLVDAFPLLNLVPLAMAPFKQHANRLFDETLALFKLHVDYVRKQMQDGKDVHCFTKYILKGQKEAELSDNESIFLAGAMYGAGSDTTSDAISTCIFLLAAFPDVQAKAQAEIDRVIGQDRLPDFVDEQDLIYCGAFIREVMRFRSVIPGGLAHATTEDDEYEGYLIPAGTTVLANHWSIHMDPEVYPDPEKFTPERFIKDGNLVGTDFSDSGHHGFGFGRRICPGAHIAQRSLFIVFTRLLWAFKITAAEQLDLNNFSSGFSSHPNHYKCEIKPRGDWVREIAYAQASAPVVLEAP